MNAQPFFSDASRLAALAIAAAHWQGTPFRENSSAPGAGGGVDCLHLAEELYAASGATPRFTFPRERMDTGLHVDGSKILAYLRGEWTADPQSAQLAAIFSEIETANSDDVLAGDLLVFRVGRSAHHLGIAVNDDGDFIHCLKPAGVTFASLHDATFARRLQAVFRPIESEVKEA
ncbi:MAG: C40 family peptidase [Verrucomicrobia bacterium]|nr:C40 family peptidase [Verrucomicrobiota bacterium]